MKRKVLFILFIFGFAAMTWAQVTGRERPHDGARRPAGEAVTISGNLIVAHGSPAIKSGDETYLVRGINRLSGFIDGLKEGAQVTIEGSSFTSPRDSKLKFLRPAKLTLNGKAYDLAPPASAFGMNKPFGPPPGMYRQFAPSPGNPGNPRHFGPPHGSNKQPESHPQRKHRHYQQQDMRPRDYRR